MVDVGSFLDVGDKVASIVGGTAGVLAVLIALRAGAKWRRGSRKGPIATLLVAQRADAARHRYRFFGEHVPALNELYVQPRAQFGDPGDVQRTRTIQAAQILSIHRHAVLLGGAGAGKSTFLATVAGQLAGQALSRRSHPTAAIIIQATDLLRRSLPEALSHAVRRDFSIEISPETFDKAVRWRILVDGLDEIVDAQERSEALWQLRDLMSAPSSHRFLISCRPLTEPELATLRGPDIGTYDLRPFDRRQLDEFARRWFAARHPGDRRHADEIAGRFLARVAGARLGPVARVPLLATIAALVHESDDSGTLPTSRSKLYDRFVDHLLDGRQSLERFRDAVDPDLLKKGIGGKKFAEWLWPDLRNHATELLNVCGAAWVADPEVRLIRVAADWLREHGPLDPMAVTPDGERLVRQLLLATGVCVLRGERVEFAHQSFGEYFAARAGAADIELGAWMELARDPTTRSLATFVAARRLDADALATGLLEVGATAAAGDLLVDGISLPAETRTRILDELLTHVIGETDQAPEALRLLAELSLDSEVLNRLAETARESSLSIWPRALIADQVASLDSELGDTLLRQVAEQGDGVVRSWIADALMEHGGRVDVLMRTPLDDEGPSDESRPLGVLARQALARRLTDVRATESERLAAARQLALGGDLAPLQAMVEAVDIDPVDRVRAASALADAGQPEPLRSASGSDSPSAAYAAAVALFERQDLTAERALHDVVHRFASYPVAFGAASRAADLGDRIPLRWLVRNAGQPQIQLAAARRLAALGETAALGWLLEEENLEPAVEAVALAEQLSAGDRAALPRLSAVMSRWGLASRRQIDVRMLLAVSGDEAARAALYRILRRPSDSYSTVQIATSLARSGDPRAFAWLRSVAYDPKWPDVARVRAAAALTAPMPGQYRTPGAHRDVVDYLVGTASKPNLRVRAATIALRQWDDSRPLFALASDQTLPPDARADAVQILADLALGSDVPEAHEFYLIDAARPAHRRTDRATEKEHVPPAQRRYLASLAEDDPTPDVVRIAAAPLLPDADSQRVLTAIADTARTAERRLAAIRRLDAVNSAAATEAFRRLVLDRGLLRPYRWWLIATNIDLLPVDDADFLEVLLDSPGDRWLVFRIARLSVSAPERVLPSLRRA
ncbi:NACHT domain-containing protein [Actinoplanes sp. NPDC048796]|uniref:NACHT domain-containing protein n=1 Tax=Actinoplanes sp. NPDC048796 TaxID=3155640 RepID=UPI0033F72357